MAASCFSSQLFCWSNNSLSFAWEVTLADETDRKACKQVVDAVVFGRVGVIQ